MLILRGGPHQGIDCKFEFFSEFEFIFETALGYGSEEWGTYFDEKNQRQKYRVSVPLSTFFVAVATSLV
jgi:hypothetical protein